jgi:2-oxoglutarate dehydrogenase E2 component (dihydrolipoamide succinyltransferase)
MHNIVERPIAVNGNVEGSPNYVSRLFHMIIELLMAKNLLVFLVKIKESLENPINELMNGDIKKSLEL